MPRSDARAELSDRQDALVRALLADGPAPPGFDPDALARAKKKLAHKRAWVAARRAARHEGAPRASVWAALLQRVSGFFSGRRRG